MSEAIKNSQEGGSPPVGSSEGGQVYVRRITHAARQDVVSLPRSLMKYLGLRRGDQLLVRVNGYSITMRPVRLDKVFSGEEEHCG